MILQSIWKGPLTVVDGKIVPPAPPTAKTIIHEVAARHALTPDDLTGPKRAGHIVKARQEAMWRCRQETALSYAQIGRAIGMRDHATIFFGERRHAERISAQ